MSTGALAQAWSALGGERPPELALHGEGALGGCPYALGDIAVAAVGCTLLAAAELAQARGASRPQAALDRGHATAAFASERLLRAERALPGGFAPLSRFAACADGHIRLHANYPRHRAALLQALGDPPGEDAAIAAVAERGAQELEDAVVAAGGAAAAVRSAERWRAHPQGEAVSGLGLLDLEPAGATSRPLAPAGALPCSGLRVLDLTRVIAGPVGTRMLAALGAQVLRVDPPSTPELELHVLDGCVGKRSTLVDARTRVGRETIERLAADADVLVQGYRPGALAALGLDARSLAERHPQLVTVTLSAWGEAGPWAGRRGFDSLVQAACGIALACGRDGAPGALPAQALDHATGYLIAATALRGLTGRAVSGRALHARLALTRTAAWVTSHASAGEGAGSLDPARDLVEVPSPAGRLRCLAPPGSLDRRALSWPRGVPAYGGDPPRWESV